MPTVFGETPTERVEASRRLDLTFPDDEDVPPRRAKCRLNSRITGYICLELLLPEVPISPGRRGAATALVAMPKATMDEDGPSPRAVGDIR